MKQVNQRGFSFIEVLIAIVLVVGLALLAAQTIAYQKKTQKQAKLIQVKRELAEELQSDVGMYTQCSRMLRTSLKNPVTLPQAFDGLIEPEFFEKRIRHPDLKISEAKLTYTLDTGSDIQKFGNSKTYIGTIELTASPRYGDPSRFMQLENIKIPLTIYDHNGGGSWADISCTNPQSPTAAMISETCTYFGGTLTSGVHCDFSRVLQIHYAGLAEGQVPMQHDPSRVRLLQLPTIMCYLDTLVTLIPDHDLSTRDPAADRYRSNRKTRFCKRPGIVYGSSVSPAPVNMSQIMKTMSPDARIFFNGGGTYAP